MQKFSGEGDTPSPDPIPLGAYGASIFAPMALKLNVTPPKKILVTALRSLRQLSFLFIIAEYDILDFPAFLIQ